MKIIVAGDPERAKMAKRFHCRFCGCIFEANSDEYVFEEFQLIGYHYCLCPTCGQKAYEKG